MNSTLSHRLPQLMSALFVLGGLATLFLLFRLQSDLSLQAGVLSAPETVAAQPIMFRLQAITVVTLVMGFISVIFLNRRKASKVVYVEKQKKASATEEKNEMDDAAVDSFFVDAILKSKESNFEVTEKVFRACCKQVEAVAGAYYSNEEHNGEAGLVVKHHFALPVGESHEINYSIGEGLVGQVAKSGKTIRIDDIPDDTVKVVSGLGTATPTHLLFIPVRNGDSTLGVTEIGLFRTATAQEVKALEQAMSKLAKFINGTATEKPKRKTRVEKNEDTEA